MSAEVTDEERRVLTAGIASYKAGRRASDLKKWMSVWEGGYFRGDGDGIDAANADHKERLRNAGWVWWQIGFLMTLFQDGWSHQATGNALDVTQPLDAQTFDEQSPTYLEELRRLRN